MMTYRMFCLLALFGNLDLLPLCLGHAAQKLPDPVPSSGTAKGILKIDDPSWSSHLFSANSVQLPLLSPHQKPLHSRINRQAPEVGDANSLFGGDPVPKLLNIQAECVNPQFIKVNLNFDRSFQGVIYTKGHFSDEGCTFAKEDTVLELRTYNFTIPTDTCGSLDNNHVETNASITEATIIVQNDPLFQDANDVARRIRCAWSDRFDKIISSRGFKVGSLAENTMDYSADAVSVWMDLRMGKDPFQGTPVTNGVVRLGSDMTIVVYIKSKIDKGLDVVIRDCVANDAKKHQQIQLTDENGCVLQKKLMTPFTITDRVGQSGASRIAYAMLKSFKFPDSLDVNIICNVAMCKGDCGISCMADKNKLVPPPKKAALAPVAKVDSSVTRHKRQVDNSTAVDNATTIAPLVKNETVFADESNSEDGPVTLDILGFHSSAKGAHEANVVPVDKQPASPTDGTHEAEAMDNTLIGKTVFLKEKEPTEVILERGIRVLSDNDITEVLVGNQNRTYDIMATTVKNTDHICITRTGFAIGLGLLLLIILILTIITVFLCCAACARRKKDTKVSSAGSINIYNSTDQLARSKDSQSLSSPISGPTSIIRGSLPTINGFLESNATGSHLEFAKRLPRDPQLKASAITLPGIGPGLGIQTNPTIRHSTQSLNTAHKNFVPEKPFLPLNLPIEDDTFDTEKVRSLRFIRHRPHSVDISLDTPGQDETTRSLRSFSVRGAHGMPSDDVGNDETPRSLRSYSVRSDRIAGAETAKGTERDAGFAPSEKVRSMRSFDARSDHSDSSDDTTTIGETPRSQGSARSGSQASLIQGNHDVGENARSLRSVSVYRN